MKSTKYLLKDLSNDNLLSMFNLCKSFNIDVIYQGIKIHNIFIDEICVAEVEPKFYEKSIVEAFKKIIE